MNEMDLHICLGKESCAGRQSGGFTSRSTFQPSPVVSSCDSLKHTILFFYHKEPAEVVLTSNQETSCAPPIGGFQRTPYWEKTLG